MRLINSVELERIKDVAEETFIDTCTIDTYAFSQDSFGDLLKVWTSGSVIACGYQGIDGSESTDDSKTIATDKAKIRVGISVSVTGEDRITCNGIQYEIKGIVLGNTCKTLTVERVQV